MQENRSLTQAELSFIETLKQVSWAPFCLTASAENVSSFCRLQPSRVRPLDQEQPACASLLRITTPLRCCCRLSQDLQQFNDFFIEKEEECIIRTQVLEEQLANAQPGTNMGKLRSAFVDLHGEASSHTPIRVKALYHLLGAVLSAVSSCPALELCTA